MMDNSFFRRFMNDRKVRHACPFQPTAGASGRAPCLECSAGMYAVDEERLEMLLLPDGAEPSRSLRSPAPPPRLR